MHSWKKIALTSALERRLPDHRVDCVLCNGWSATVLIAGPREGEGLCVAGVRLDDLDDEAAVHHLAEQLHQEMNWARATKPCR